MQGSEPHKRQKTEASNQEQAGKPGSSQDSQSADTESRAAGGDADPDGKYRWTSLEHHGVTFPPAYKPLPTEVKLKVKATGLAVDLPAEHEEMATWWAEVEVTDFGKKQKVMENFQAEFLPKIDAKYGIKALNELDFQDVRTHLEQTKEEKRNRPIEVRKKETEDRQKALAAYQYCVIDNEKLNSDLLVIQCKFLLFPFVQ